MYQPMATLETLQDHYLLTEDDTGVIYNSLVNTDMYDLLQPYIEESDYNLYFHYSERLLRPKFFSYDRQTVTINFKERLIEKAVYYALKSEEYNLKTLIGTINIDYNPLENYFIKESITSTSSIGGYTEYGERTATGTTSYGSFVNETVDELGAVSSTHEISKPEYSTLKTLNHGTVDKEFHKDETLTTGSHTDTLTHNKGAETDNHETSTDFGQVVTDTSSTSNIGNRKNTIGVEETVSAYNTTSYQPNSKTDTSNTTDAATDSTNGKETVSGHMDTANTTDTLGERQDKDTNIYGERIDKVEANNSEKTVGYVDSETFHQDAIQDTDTFTEQPKTNKSTVTNNPHSVDSSTVNSAHRDENERTENGSRERELHGRYGYNTVQDMIQAERELADLSISNKIIDIVIHAISEGVLYTW